MSVIEMLRQLRLITERGSKGEKDSQLMGKQNEFELLFRDFVSGFGGEVLTETSDGTIADYIFRQHNIVAELKCLMEDQTQAMNKKLTQAVRDWWRKDGMIPAGYDSSKPVEIATAPKEIADRWLEILKAPIENFIRDANRQIRATKSRLNLPDAKGLLLVFNQGNALHNRPKDFRLLMASVLRKRDKEKERRFPHIHGVVYFSYDTIKTEQESMNFWAALELKTGANEDLTLMTDFQNGLQQAWYAFVEKKWGKRVRQFRKNEKQTGHTGSDLLDFECNRDLSPIEDTSACIFAKKLLLDGVAVG